MAGKGRGFGGQQMNPMLKQLERLQAQVMEAQAALANETVTGTAGGGAVSVVMNGHRQLQSVTISPEVVDPEDVGMLQDLIVAAFSDAAKKVEDLVASKLGPLGGGMKIPGLM